MPDPIVQLEGITKRYDGTEADVLAGINLTVCPGDSIAIIGPSGCGKSTLLNIIGTLDAPTAGTVKLDGSDLYAMSETKLAEVRNKRFGFVFQDHHLLPQCTAIENVLIPTLAGFTGAADAEPRAVALLNRVGLQDRIHYPPSELSGGQRQRVAIVRALVNQPDLLLIDEPTGALDDHAAAGIVDLLVELNQQDNVALLLVTHDARLASRMKKTLRLTEGGLVEGEV